MATAKKASVQPKKTTQPAAKKATVAPTKSAATPPKAAVTATKDETVVDPPPTTNSKQPASIGRIVHALVDPRTNNGFSYAPGLITAVTDVDGEERVNLRVFLDTGEHLRLNNVELFDNRADADADDVDRAAEGHPKAAFWPPKV